MEGICSMAQKNHRARLIPQLIQAYGEWVEDYIDQGFRVYLLTFKFNQIPGSNTAKISEMLSEIENRFYSTLVKHVERWPMKPSRQRNLPRLLAVPDLPVKKKTKNLSAKDININDGLHVHAMLSHV
jgi:hypothetical protein